MSEAAVCLSVCLSRPSLCSCRVNTWGEFMRCLGKAGGRAGGRRRGDAGLPVSLVTVSLPGWTLPSGRTRRPLDHTQNRGAVSSPHVSHTSCAWRRGRGDLCPWAGRQVRQRVPCSNGDSGGCNRRLNREARWFPEEAKPGLPADEGWRGRWAMHLGSPREGCLHAHRATPGLEPGAHVLPANCSVTPQGPAAGGLWGKGSDLPCLAAASEAGGPRFRQSPSA